MKPLFIATFLVVLAAGAIAGLKANELKLWLGDVTMPLREGMYRSRNVMVPMRDGVRLATDVYRQDGVMASILSSSFEPLMAEYPSKK